MADGSAAVGASGTKNVIGAKRQLAARAPRMVRTAYSLDDFGRIAWWHLPRMLYGYVAGATETNAALRANVEAYEALSLVPRMLRDTTARSSATTLMGETWAQPFGIPPMGLSAAIAYRGDIVLARAARAAGIPAIMSASSLIPMEEVRKEAGVRWYQAYLPGETDRIEKLVDRVIAAGFDTFVLTADVPVPANRENNLRTGFSVPLQPSLRLVMDGVLHPHWLFRTWLKTFQRHGMPHFENMDAHRGPPILSRDLVRAVGKRDGLGWEHLALIRKRWPGKLVVKGILSPEDARLAREGGADGVIVSNHGGRQLDHALAPLLSLPAIKAQAGGMAVMIDGGIRRGTDILKALALGADFCFVGRPFLFAAALAGEEGVAHAIGLLAAEVERDMALLGINSPAAMEPGMVVPRGAMLPA
jgi:L-lactate dehydrogenase (cytochrome)